MSGFRRSSSLGFSSFDNPRNFEEYISSGIKTLDNLIDIVPGAIICIYEDKFSSIHNTLLQIFISSCFNENKKFCILATEDKLLKRFNKIKSQKLPEVNNDSLVIAWRYKGLDTSNEHFYWDLLNKLDLEENYQLRNLENLLEKLKTSVNCCFAIFSIFSPLYDQFTNQNMNQSQYIHQIFYEIRKYTKLNNHTVIMSLPNFLYNSNFTLYFDTILQIVNNLSLPQETPLYNCFIEILKLSKPGSLRVNFLESYKYGLVLKSKKIEIEKIDIKPEETVPKTTGCASNF